MATKERSKIEKPYPRRPSAKTSPVKHAQTNAELRHQLAESLQRENATASENERLLNALTEALEHQTATAEVVGITGRFNCLSGSKSPGSAKDVMCMRYC